MPTGRNLLYALSRTASGNSGIGGLSADSAKPREVLCALLNVRVPNVPERQSESDPCNPRFDGARLTAGPRHISESMGPIVISDLEPEIAG